MTGIGTCLISQKKCHGRYFAANAAKEYLKTPFSARPRVMVPILFISMIIVGSRKMVLQSKINPYYSNENGILYCGDAQDILRQLDSDSVDLVVTSPPYWGLRAYESSSKVWDGDPGCDHEWTSFIRRGQTGGTRSPYRRKKDKENFQLVPDALQDVCSKCGAWKGELGSEPSFQLYIDHLIKIFDEARRVLKPAGSCWVNLGDSYAHSGPATNLVFGNPEFGRPSRELVKIPRRTTSGIAKKSLIGIPDRFKIAMIDRGWICRNEIIWHKNNAMPVSAKDRFTGDYEKFYFFVKSPKYYFEQQFEPTRWVPNKAKKRNMRSVWSVSTHGFGGNHFATYPPKLLVPIISACCPPEEGVVLDPFMGSGTTAIVAEMLNRKWIGIDISEPYCEISVKRIEKDRQNTGKT